METVCDSIKSLMNVLASLDLYWRSMGRNELNNVTTNESLVRIAGMLEQHVFEVSLIILRIICTNIASVNLYGWLCRSLPELSHGKTPSA